MRDKVNQMFKDKLFLVMLVLGLLTIVAAAGIVTVQRGNGSKQSPYLDVEEPGNMVAEEFVTEEKVAGNSNSEKEKVKETKDVLVEGTLEEPVAQVGVEKDAATPFVLNFSDTSKMAWPIQGNILLDYSMESTIYFPTLDQYKCNPGVVIQGDVSQPVLSPTNAKIVEVGVNEELGNFVRLDFGNDYTALCGQLKEIAVVENEYIEKGQILGYIAEPTKYYSVEGANVFFELKHQNKVVDPVDYFE